MAVKLKISYWYFRVWVFFFCVASLYAAFPSLPLFLSLVFLSVCTECLYALSLWFTPSNSRALTAKKLLVFLRDFPHLLCVYIFFFHPLTLHRLPLNLLVSSSLSFTSSCSILIFISQAPGCIFFSLHVTRLVSCSSWPSAFGVVWFVLLRFCSQRSSSFLCLAFSLSHFFLSSL